MIRGCNIFGRNPQANLILYSDNCSSHSTDEQILKEARHWRVHERWLLKNCTHLQQPVDQHCGHWMQKFIQTKYWHFGEQLLDEVDCEERKEDDKVGAKEKRGLIVKWASEAMDESRKLDKMFKNAWVNFGLYLPIDGSKDKELETIV
eukprot:922895_1